MAAKIPGGADSFSVDSGGNVRLLGTATVFDDLSYPLLTQSFETPASKIVTNKANASITFKNDATTSDYVVLPPQLSHRWKLATKIYPHVHWEQVSANVPNWLLQYRWQMQGQAKTTAWTNLARKSTNAFTYTSGTLNQITAFGADGITPPANAGLSDILQFRLIRDTANGSGLFAGADPETADVEATSFDVHIEMDSLGSNQEYIKD